MSLTPVEFYQIADNQGTPIQTSGFFVTGSNHLMDFVDSSENALCVDGKTGCLSPFGLL